MMKLTNFSVDGFARNITAGDYLEDFLIAAITSFLFIRFFLYVTGFPQLGGGTFHIAHMLWGGLLMFAAIVVLLAFLNRPSYTFAAILGGIGFGAFVDEIGKFITRDNDYFFQPSIAIIYVIFIGVYLIIKALQSRQKYSQKEYLINAIEVIKEAVQNDMDAHEKALARHYLAMCDPKDPFVKDLKDMLENAAHVHRPPTTLPSLIKRKLHNFYLMLINKRWFVKATLVVFGLSALLTLTSAVILGYGLESNRVMEFFHPEDLSFSSLAQIISSTVSAVLVLLGGMVIFRSRLKGFRLLKYSVLISIFFTQVFAFYRDELSALVGLIWYLFLFTIIQYYINEEEGLRHEPLRA